ncbi:unnamed protein product [Aspergillus oryzae var. brunneus]|uniref:Unnamed protein product n=1 Tax=Aspergillus oryzae var. brunneus TaxID=332754 RepID=A0ABQ6KSC6_ASPOZ|nr:unnamed protein product [Aspergillus oryzae]GMG45324.1 unnamed protein product [Aspergillus oryzae var. brunneus]
MRCAKTPPPYGRGTNGGDVQWKVLVVDETSRKLIDNAVSEDDILNLNVTSKPGEYPVIRYYKPRAPTHEASVMCSHLARFIQNELDQFAHFQKDFPPPSQRPRGVLMVVDRSMDVVAPLIHEFTYQSMVHDLLPIKDGDKVTYKTIINEGSHNEELKEMEISENDNVWVDYRHLHMKDVLGKLGEDFAKFRAANPQFAEE